MKRAFLRIVSLCAAIHFIKLHSLETSAEISSEGIIKHHRSSDQKKIIRNSKTRNSISITAERLANVEQSIIEQSTSKASVDSQAFDRINLDAVVHDAESKAQAKVKHQHHDSHLGKKRDNRSMTQRRSMQARRNAVKKTLIWGDDFDVDGPPDSSIWRYDFEDAGSNNNQAQIYTDRLENVEVSDGTLKLRAKRERFKGYEYTSGSIMTYGKKDLTYGRVEVKAKVPTGSGVWPAIWMLPNAIYEGSWWPMCGEIDIMESVGNQPNEVHFSCHTQWANFRTGGQATSIIHTDLKDQWHTYGMTWTLDRITGDLDGKEYFHLVKADDSESSWPFKKPFFLILNVAVGGNWGAYGGLDPIAFEGEGQIMEVDWVKVYDLGDSVTTTGGGDTVCHGKDETWCYDGSEHNCDDPYVQQKCCSWCKSPTRESTTTRPTNCVEIIDEVWCDDGNDHNCEDPYVQRVCCSWCHSTTPTASTRVPTTPTTSTIESTTESTTEFTTTRTTTTMKSDQCFPSNAMVSVLLECFEPLCSSRAIVARRMDQLQLGDNVLGAKGFSKVFAFMDNNQELVGRYLHLQTNDGSELVVSAGHIVYAHKEQIPVLAESLVRGDTIWLVENQNAGQPALLPVEISAVLHAPEFGLHAPLTEDGTLVVNNILVSSYAGVESVRWGAKIIITGHDAARLAHMPLLWSCSFAPYLCGSSWHSPHLGRHVWTQWIIDHLGWLRTFNSAYADLQLAILDHPTVKSLLAVIVQLLAVSTLRLLEWSSRSFLLLFLFAIAPFVARRSAKSCPSKSH